MQREGKNALLSLFLLGICLSASAAGAGGTDKQVRITGRVTDFADRPIAGASIGLKDSGFRNVAETTTGSDGRYALSAAKGNYTALTAVKDYQTKFLEYWAWNVPAAGDLEINPRFDRLEVYAVNAWQPQGAYPSYQIYFRPMILTKVMSKVTAAGGMEKFSKLPRMNIAPDLGAADIAVSIDGQAVGVLKVNKVLESVGPGQDMIGYVVQAELPKRRAAGSYSVITITLTDHETGEKGEGCLFIPKGS
jgi:hypothetical protein